ncbi:MAG: hypothetical protein KDK54_04995 [Leptospiraceae bacterium]|nr:hypothetical protein [Leptospiraceae bacterium]
MDKRRTAKEVFLDQQKMDIEEDESFLGVEEKMYSPELPMQSVVAYPSPPPPPKGAFSQNYSTQNMEKSSMKSKKKQYIPNLDIKSSEEMQLEKDPIQFRINGFWIWKRVIVPPNAYVVHTRLNKKEPVTIGLGVSFRFNPYKDAFLIIPAAMQTIGVVANCITKEKQGINVLAYVQWQIHDFSIAYKKLDLTNSRDPLGIVNAQLREQAEAAIKDKIATMSVEDVLTDKAPIIEELTSRLSRVAEGQEGLGIKIITVQIREAVVSSATLWEDLQAPFRNQERQKARISQLELETEINRKELETRKWKETREAETNFEIEETRQKKFTETVDVKLKQELIRFEEEQNNLRKKRILEEETNRKLREVEDERIQHSEELRLKQELEDSRRQEKKTEEIERLQLEADKRRIQQEQERQIYEAAENAKLEEELQTLELKSIERKTLLSQKENEFDLLLEKQKAELELLKVGEESKQKEIQLEIKEKEQLSNIKLDRESVGVFKLKEDILNSVHPNRMTGELIRKLPEIASHLPKPDEIRILQSDSDPLFNSLGSFVQKILSLSDFVQKGNLNPEKKD